MPGLSCGYDLETEVKLKKIIAHVLGACMLINICSTCDLSMELLTNTDPNVTFWIRLRKY